MQGLQGFALFLIVLSNLTMVSAHGGEPVKIQENIRQLNLLHFADYYQDRDGSLNVSDLERVSFASQFKPVRSDTLNRGATRSVIWLRFDIHGSFSSDKALEPWLIQAGHPSLDLVTLYRKENNARDFVAVHAGDKYPYGVRSVAHPEFLFPIEVSSGQSSRFYLRVETNGVAYILLKLWSPLAYLENSTIDMILSGGLLGLLFALLLYSLTQGLVIRDTVYLFYTAYLGSVSLYILSFSGLGAAFFWPELPFLSNSSAVFMSMMGVTSLLLARSFMQLEVNIPWLNRLFILFIMLAILAVPMSVLLDYSSVLQLMLSHILFSLPAVVLAGSWFWLIKKQLSMHGFVLAFLLLTLTGGSHIMMLLGHIPVTSQGVMLTASGLVVQVLLLAWALSDRVRRLGQERLKKEQYARNKMEMEKNRLQESNRLKGAFLQAISRELSSPLNQVADSLDDLAANESTREQKGLLEHARKSSHEMNSIISHLLTLTELQSATVTVANQPFHLQKQLDILVERYTAKAQSKHLALKIDVDDSVPHVLYGDKDKLMQALAYLIDNAIRFTEFGQIVVQAFASIKPEGYLLSLQVRDTGEGIPEAHQQRVFDAFYQVQEDHSGGQLGLGLAVCQHLVNLLGGSVRYRDGVAEGACFQLDVDCSQNSP